MKLHVKTEGSVENQTPLQKTIIADDDSAVVSNDKIMVLITQRIPWNSASFIFCDNCIYLGLTISLTNQ